MEKHHRVLEPEAMESLEEVIAYDRLTMKYLQILHNGFIETILNGTPERGCFLEVGSGSGRISIGIAKQNKSVEITGIDLSENMITVARKNAIEEKVSDFIDFQLASATEIPFPDHSFDAVYCHNMLHHIPNIDLAVKEMLRVLKPSGGFFIRDLVRQSPLVTALHVNVFGLTYNSLMKKEYRDSIKASLSWEEIDTLFASLELPGKKLRKYFLTHFGIEKQAQNRRTQKIEVSTPAYIKFMKNMYVAPR